MYTDLALYIDGKWVNGGGRKGEDVLNPATGKPLAHLPHASKADLDEALEAAKKGFTLWRATSAYDRAKIMRKAADLMRERHDAISKVLVQALAGRRGEPADIAAAVRFLCGPGASFITGQNIQVNGGTFLG